jgi:hypothetical protein
MTFRLSNDGGRQVRVELDHTFDSDIAATLEQLIVQAIEVQAERTRTAEPRDITP